MRIASAPALILGSMESIFSSFFKANKPSLYLCHKSLMELIEAIALAILISLFYHYGS